MSANIVNLAEEGLSLRDQLAMAALAAMAAPLMGGGNNRKRIAITAYAWADDMLEVRTMDPSQVKLLAERYKSSLGG